MYNINAEKITSFTYGTELTIEPCTHNRFRIDNQYFEIKDYVVSVYPYRNDLLNSDKHYSYNGYRYSIGSKVVITNGENTPYTFDFPEEYKLVESFILANGDVVTQCFIETDDEVYDVNDHGTHYIMTTYLITPTGEEKKLDFPYKIYNIYNRISTKTIMDSYNITADNIIIAEKYVDGNSEGSIIGLATNDLIFEGAFQNTTSLLSIVNPTRLFVYSEDYVDVYNDKGKKLNTLENYQFFNRKFYGFNGDIYDWDFNKLASFIDYNYVYNIGSNILFSKTNANNENELYLFDGEFKKIDIAYSELQRNIYAKGWNLHLSKGDDGYTYYDENTVELLTVDYELVCIAQYKSRGYTYEKISSSQYAYYRIDYTSAYISLPY